MSAKQTKSPNIAFVGAKDGKEPLRTINNGDSVIHLPKNQAQPFFHPDASAICKMFGWLYKPVQDK